MGYDQKRYSPLKQISASNVKRLVPVWNATLSNLLGEQAQPLVYNGVMYVTNAAWTFAIDVTTGKQIWRTEVGYEADTPRVVCCGVSNKGPAIFGGKLFRTTLDAHVVRRPSPIRTRAVSTSPCSPASRVTRADAGLRRTCLPADRCGRSR